MVENTSTTQRFRATIRRTISNSAHKISKAVTINAKTNLPARELEIGEPDNFTFVHHRHLHFRHINPPTDAARTATQDNVRSAAFFETAIPRRNTEPSLRPDLFHEVSRYRDLLQRTRASLTDVRCSNRALSHESQMLHLQLERTRDVMTTNQALRREICDIRGTPGGDMHAELEQLRAERDRLEAANVQLEENVAMLRQTNELPAGVEVFILALLARIQGPGQGHGGNDAVAA